MKLFWAIIALFAVAAFGVAWVSLSDERRGGDRWAKIDHGAPTTPQQDATSRDEARPPRFADDLEQTVDVRARVLGTSQRQDDADIDVSDARERDPRQELVDDLLNGRSDDDDDAPSSAARPDGAPGDPVAPGRPDVPGSAGGPPMVPGDHEDHTEPQQAENPWKDGAPIEDDDAPGRLEHSVEERDDGSIVLDSMFEIRGSGTRNDPYQITWDLLMSAAETFQPRLGMDEIPERIMMLDGKYVQITGHLLFPMASFETDEVLVMLNMWDGCCLGTMPSPYDALEVQLSERVRADARRAMSYGSLTGRLSVDPYLINDWLIGLYVVEDGSLRMDM